MATPPRASGSSSGWNGKTGVTVLLSGIATLAVLHSTLVMPGILRAAEQDARRMLDHHVQQRDADIQRRETAIIQRLDRMESSLGLRLQRIEDKVGR